MALDLVDHPFISKETREGFTTGTGVTTLGIWDHFGSEPMGFVHRKEYIVGLAEGARSPIERGERGTKETAGGDIMARLGHDKNYYKIN